MKKLKHIINGILWTFVGVYAAVIVLLQIPTIQAYVGAQTAGILGRKLGTKVELGRIDLGFLNRIIIDDVHMFDQKGEHMFSATRISVTPDISELLNGRISITSAQLFGLKALLYQENASAKPNFQFLLDSLASKDSTSHTPLDLQVRSLILRHGSISFHRKDVAPTSGKLTPHHIVASNISTHIILNRLTDDSLNLNVKRLSFKEQSGLQLKDLKFKFIANKQGARLEEFNMKLPRTELLCREIKANYRFNNDRFDPTSLVFNGEINKSKITPSDISSCIPELKEFVNPIFIHSVFSGTGTELRVSELEIGSQHKSIALSADGSVNNWNTDPRWAVNIHNLHLSADGIKFVADNLGAKIGVPEEITRLGNINYQGRVDGSVEDISANGTLKTDAGNMTLAFSKHQQQFNGNVNTSHLNLGQILANNDFGTLATSINVNGTLPGKQAGDPIVSIKGIVSAFEYNSYTYQHIAINGTYRRKSFDGLLEVNDPNARITFNGKLDTSAETPAAQLVATVQDLNPSALHLSNKWNDSKFRFRMDADFTGSDINNANGTLSVTDLVMEQEEVIYAMQSFLVEAENRPDGHQLKLSSDFAQLQLEGNYDYKTLVQSITNTIADKLPTLPGLPARTSTRNNNFSIKGRIDRSDWMEALLGIPVELNSPATIDCSINDLNRSMSMEATLPSFSYEGAPYEDAHISIGTPNDTLRTQAHVRKVMKNGERFDWNLLAHAANNRLSTRIAFDNHQELPFKGELNADAQFYNNSEGMPTAQIDIQPSYISINDTLWNVRPSQITYSENNLHIDRFTIVSNDNQHLVINGRGTKSLTDSLTVDLKDINVRYILDLVDFHSVDFDGRATGQACVAGLFKQPEAQARLVVEEFRFENGRMGTLTAEAHMNNETEQIDINAIAEDEDNRHTLVNGFVSPQRNEIDLELGARGTRGEFLESFCGSFMNNVDINIEGDLRLHGPLDAINLTGTAKTTGTLGITPLNTTYRLNDLVVRLIPNEILFENDTIFDRDGNIGIVNGALHHKCLTQLTYDIGVEARNLLAFDYKDFDGGTICGTVYGTGNCNIRGRSGEVVFDINVTPNNGTTFAYNAASPDALRSQEFVHWKEGTQEAEGAQGVPEVQAAQYTDIRMNLLINATPDATLRVVMDQESGDYITLNGSGVLRATYYNKGAFDMFGTYVIDHGTYKMTIQNVIKKDFNFLRGGNIVFGGDPYNAQLNLQAQYVVNGVSLSDLQIGRSFTSNNIRVNCLMNISGTPYSPRIDFDLDMPTVDSNAKQMVFSLINSEEEMNQQVLYLLAVGRFYAPNNNNAATERENQQSQTSLAMQSILSGALSQQLSNIIGSVANSSKWSIGANISTGAEGFYNAEYEGLLSGRLLHNRLLINGQFGYRDNVNNPESSSFIGDFDMRYLLRPNGNLAVKVYNQTNDRYFTRNSLTTQGLGIIMKKDFNGFRDLFGLKKKEKRAKSTKTSKRTRKKSQ